MATTEDFSKNRSDYVIIQLTFDRLRLTQNPRSAEFKATVFTISQMLDNIEKKYGLDCVVDVLEAIKERTHHDLVIGYKMYEKLYAHGYITFPKDMLISESIYENRLMDI